MGSDVIDDLNGVSVLPPLHLPRITLHQLYGPTMFQPVIRNRFDSILLDPEPVLWIRIRWKDPYVFGPPGSRSIIICMDPDPSIITEKLQEKP